DREQVGAHGPHHEPVDGAADALQAGAGVVVREDGGGASAPAPPDLHPYAGVRLEIADVVGPVPVLGDDPERVPVEAVPDRVLPRPAPSCGRWSRAGRAWTGRAPARTARPRAGSTGTSA